MPPATYERMRRACERLGTPQAAAMDRLVSAWCEAVGEPVVPPAEARVAVGRRDSKGVSGVWSF